MAFNSFDFKGNQPLNLAQVRNSGFVYLACLTIIEFFSAFLLRLFICNLFIAVSVCQSMICHGRRWGEEIVCFFLALLIELWIGIRHLIGSH